MSKNEEGFSIPAEAAQYAVDSSMINILDRDVLVYTRDGKYFTGRLISFDQYGSIVLKRANERLIFQDMYNDRVIGIIVISTSSIVYIGRHKANIPIGMRRIDRQTIQRLIQEDKSKRT